MRNPLCGFGSFGERGPDRVSGSPDETLKRLLQLTRVASLTAQTLMIIKWRSNTVSILPACLSSSSCWSKGTGNACGHASFRAKAFYRSVPDPMGPQRAFVNMNIDWLAHLKPYFTQTGNGIWNHNHHSHIILVVWTKLQLWQEEWINDSLVSQIQVKVEHICLCIFFCTHKRNILQAQGVVVGRFPLLASSSKQGIVFDTSQTSWWHYPTCVFNYWQSVKPWNSVQASFHGGQWQSYSTGWPWAAHIWTLMWFVRLSSSVGRTHLEYHSFELVGEMQRGVMCLFLSKKVCV